MYKTAPCYSLVNYYDYFNIDVEGKRVLDIGSFVGSFKKSKKFNSSIDKLSKAKKYVTIDINPDSGADVICDAHSLPFKNSEFNIIIANNVIEHFYDPRTAVSEMNRVLKKGGLVYFTIPFLYPVHEAPHDYHRFTKYGLLKLLENFKDVEIHARGGVFSTSANLIYKTTHALDRIRLGVPARAVLYPPLWLWVQLDRIDKSDAFVRTYFGKAQK